MVELLIAVAIVAILLVVVGAYVFKCDAMGGDPADTDHAAREVLPGKVNIVCIEGHEYIFVQNKLSYSRAAMAPRFDDEGRPVRCRAER